MGDAHRQTAYDVRFDWGLEGAAAVGAGADVAVVVDVLSFTTTLSVALDVGTVVLPYRWGEEGAHSYAQEQGAVLAVGRSEAGADLISLSPATLRRPGPPARLVLPSPNGSTIASWLGSEVPRCLGASLRNSAAVARWISSQHPSGTSVAVIAAGEQWPSGALRPAAEDLWGAGAVIAGLAANGWVSRSPEAELSRVGYEAVRGHERAALLSCASGRDLIEAGYTADVEIAAETGHSNAVPLLEEHRFVPAAWSDDHLTG